MSVSQIYSKITETYHLTNACNPTRVLIRPACLKIETRRHGVSLCCSIINMMFSSDTLSKNEDGLTQNSRYVEWLLSDIATSIFLIFFLYSTPLSSVVEPPLLYSSHSLTSSFSSATLLE